MAEPIDHERRVVYYDGRILSAAEARLPIDDWGLLYGLGFFETFRTSGGRPHHWNFNRSRLEQACATAGIRVPATFLAANEERLRETVRTLLRENQLSDAVFRYTLTGGNPAGGAPGGELRAPAEFLILRPIPPPSPATGIALRVLALSRDDGEWLPRPKSLNYANAIAGSRELQKRSPALADEGLFLSRKGGFVVETSRQAVAWLKDERLFYPDPNLGAVAGTCLRWALQSDIPSEARRALLGEFLAADAIIVLNAVRGITPVHEIWDDGDRNRLRVLPSHEHPVVVKLQQAWDDALRMTATAP